MATKTVTHPTPVQTESGPVFLTGNPTSDGVSGQIPQYVLDRILPLHVCKPTEPTNPVTTA